MRSTPERLEEATTGTDARDDARTAGILTAEVVAGGWWRDDCNRDGDDQDDLDGFADVWRRRCSAAATSCWRRTTS